MFAAALASQCPEKFRRVTLIESEAIGTLGVGEATQPLMKAFNERIGVNEADMMRATRATFKLGIEFNGWGAENESYFHPFGTYGDKPGGLDFLQHWLRASSQGSVSPLADYSFCVEACKQNRFDFPDADETAISSTYNYAYHFDAGLYANYLRERFTGKGVHRIEGKITQVISDKEVGNIQALKLESGQIIPGDYFIDCSGFNSLLMEQTLGVDFVNWSHWLPCDRAVAIPCEKSGELLPYTKSTAQAAGWQWRIPLQHRTGNGYVYCSDFMSDDEAVTRLFASLDGKALADPDFIRFQTGYRKYSWFKNCIAIGLASGFLEPLESTSLYLVQVAIFNFLDLFPAKTPDPVLIREFNRRVENEYVRARDFLILHYHATKRGDSGFWQYCKDMNVPESLSQKITLFKKRGFLNSHKFGAFPPSSWISVMTGQGVWPDSGNPLFKNIALEQVDSKFEDLRRSIKQGVQNMPTHQTFVDEYCAEMCGDVVEK